VLSTHHLDEVETVCQRFGLMHRGKMLAEGTLEELRYMSGQERMSEIFRTLVRNLGGEQPENSEAPHMDALPQTNGEVQ